MAKPRTYRSRLPTRLRQWRDRSIVECYIAGQPVKIIALDHEVSLAEVDRAIKRHNVQPRRKRR